MDFTLHTERDREALQKALSLLDLKKPWKVTIGRHKKQRSLAANAYYWVILGVVANETGNSADDMHEAFKSMFCPIREIRFGDEVALTRSSAKLTVGEFAEYLTKVEAFITSQLGIILPAPDYSEAA